MTFIKGQSGNPGGRPKKDWSWNQLLESVGEEIEERTGKKFKELVAKRLWVACVNGNILAIKELFNRMEGLPMQATDITTGGEKITTLVILDTKPDETKK